MISHAHKTVFVHIPKCAGQSVEQAFLNDLGLTWQDRAPLLLGRNPRPGQGPPRLAHLMAREYTALGHITPQDWARYHSFSVVRDPYARAVSLSNYLKPVPTLAAFVQDWLPEQFALAPRYDTPGHQNPGMYHFLRPQSDFIHDTHGTCLVDRVYRFETLKTAWPDIQKQTGLTSDLPHRNASASHATTSDLTPHDRKQIAVLYESDFATLGYSQTTAHRLGGLFKRNRKTPPPFFGP